MEKSHGRRDEHYPVIMKGTPLYCQPRQAGRQPLDPAARRRRPVMHLCALMSLPEEQDKRTHGYIYTMSVPALPYQQLRSLNEGNVKRKSRQM